MKKPAVLVCDRMMKALALCITIAILGSPACSARMSAPASSEAKESSVSAAEGSLKKANLTYADRIAWRAQLKWPQDCEASFDYPDKSFSGLAFFELSPHRYLVQVTCNLGTYQGTYMFFSLDESRSPSSSKLLSFTDYEDSGERGPNGNRLQKIEAAQLTGTPEFDASNQQLRLINKFRGLGDCGFVATYGFSKEQPELVLLQAKLQCDGKTTPSPLEWKKISPP